jgi:hypothetical protein
MRREKTLRLNPVEVLNGELRKDFPAFSSLVLEPITGGPIANPQVGSNLLREGCSGHLDLSG